MEAKPPFREINHGNCGSVWAVDRDGPASALKFEDMNVHRDIHNDARMHQRIESAIKDLRATDNADLVRAINVPEYRNLIARDDEKWWSERLPRLPDERQACNALISERILPFSKPVREDLIDRYCHDGLKDMAKTNRNQEDCIVRCYLGRRRRKTRPSPVLRAFNLRNYPLHVDQMEELGLPIESYAEVLADVLAVLHWVIKVDAGDVEFVLAPPRDDASGDLWQSQILGTHTLWMLDFDLVRDMSMDEAGLERAVAAFYRNDPYFPRPGISVEADQKLWQLFRERYLQSSGKLLKDTGWEDLPGRMVERLQEAGEELAKRRETLTSRTRISSSGFGH